MGGELVATGRIDFGRSSLWTLKCTTYVKQKVVLWYLQLSQDSFSCGVLQVAGMQVHIHKSLHKRRLDRNASELLLIPVAL